MADNAVIARDNLITYVGLLIDTLKDEHEAWKTTGSSLITSYQRYLLAAECASPHLNSILTNMHGRATLAYLKCLRIILSENGPHSFERCGGSTHSIYFTTLVLTL